MSFWVSFPRETSDHAQLGEADQAHQYVPVATRVSVYTVTSNGASMLLNLNASIYDYEGKTFSAYLCRSQ